MLVEDKNVLYVLYRDQTFVCMLQAHYDLAITVALCWLDKDGAEVPEREDM